MRIPKYLIRSAAAAILLCGLSRVSLATDAESDWNFNIGGGYSPPVGGINSILTDGWNFTLGAGYNFSEEAGVILEYMNNHLGVENGVMNRYSTLLGGLPTDGGANVWSLTVNPTWRFELSRVVGVYLIGGGGYYHVNANITTPGVGFVPPYCDYYWGCWPGGFIATDNIVAEHKDDTGGVNAGVGFTFLLGQSGAKFYVESRYHYIMTKGPDLTLLPLTAGIRF